MTQNNYEEFLYRKQFFYGPEKAPYKDWKNYPMPEGMWLSAHPNLNIVQTALNGFEATLIGFMLNPYNPFETDQEILNRLCANNKTIDQFIEATDPLGGRWAVILRKGDSSIAFNDPAGARTIFYHIDPQGRTWLGTQPGLFADRFGFVESEESQEFRKSPEYIRKPEVWWPGECTPFTEVKQLLPNHFLDLQNGQSSRFWPNKKIEKYNLKEGTRLAGDILRGVIAGAHHRYKLAMSLSSGIDSRTVFSGCKDFAQEITVFNMKYRKLEDDSADVRVPAAIAQRFNLNFKVFDCREFQSPDFKKVFDRHVIGLKTDWANIAEARAESLPADVVVLKGSISEIMRCRYWSVGQYPTYLTFDNVVSMMGLGSSPMVVNNLRKWMDDALPAEKYGMKLLDLLSWEIEVGNWYAMGHDVFDIAQEDFTPFNNRKFFTIMLGIDPKYRTYPDHIAQRELIKYLWPELTEFPYTPGREIPKKRLLDSAVAGYLRRIKHMIRK